MRNLIKTLPILTLPFLLLLSACGSEEEDPFVQERFRGTFMAGDTTIVGDVKVDSVELTITDPERYALRHFDYDNRLVDFCDSKGSVMGVGTNEFIFFSVKYTTANCDSISGVNKRVFAAIYSHDSLWLAHSADSTDHNICEFDLVLFR